MSGEAGIPPFVGMSQSGATSPYTVTPPAGTTSGDLILVVLREDSDASAVPASGYTLISRDSTSDQFAWFWRRAGFNEQPLDLGGRGAMIVYRGVATSPFVVSEPNKAQYLAASGGTARAMANLDVTAPGRLVWAFASFSTITATTPAGMTKRSGDPAVAVVAFDEALTSAVTNPPRSSTVTTTAASEKTWDAALVLRGS